jgi:BirA family transcriptional regulator, biotin operon repressor / biotin---[acetyl-CoA-carboxylase] ligase
LTDLWPDGVDRVILEATDSTNAHALREAPNLKGPTWFMAREQTAGRGRRERPWSSPRGNFHATLLMFPQGPADQVALRSFVAALALYRALAQLTGLPQALALKWPNDVLLNGAKVAGILLEASSLGGGVHHLAIGIGVNLIAHPDQSHLEEGALPATSVLHETGKRIEPEHLLAVLAQAVADLDADLTTQGFSPLRQAWLGAAARLGQVIRARTGKDSFHGVFETIDSSGNLILQTENGRLAIPAADVFF